MSANNVVVVDLKTRNFYECNAEEVCGCGSFGCIKMNKKIPKTLKKAILEAQYFTYEHCVEYGLEFTEDVKKDSRFHKCKKCK